MPNTHKASVVAQYILDQTKLISGRFGIKRVSYGDVNIIVDAPIVCVIPTTVDRSWSGSSLNVDNDFETSMLVYGSSIRQGADDVQKFVDELSENLADYFNVLALGPEYSNVVNNISVTGTRFDGLITQGMNSRIEYAYKVMGDELTRMNRIIFKHMSRVGLVG